MNNNKKYNIGFVTTWLNRGATNVTKTYLNLLEDEFNTFIFARGGEYSERGNPNFDFDNVTWGYRLRGTEISWMQLKKWIKINRIDLVFFNEQSDINIIVQIKEKMPKLKIGCYVDYYKENTVEEFKMYDFLICNTHRHAQVFSWHKNMNYVKWGTTIDSFNKTRKIDDQVVFFHSRGMSERKGTKFVIDAFINGKFTEKNCKLIIHTQNDIHNLLNQYNIINENIEIIVGTYDIPGLYHTGDIYLYPTLLDGLGLTVYEALAAGLPVIATDVPPINEIIVNEVNGLLVSVKEYRTRYDAYYWPQAIVDTDSLIATMNYYVENRHSLSRFKKEVKEKAINEFDIRHRSDQVKSIFYTALSAPNSKIDLKFIKSKINNERKVIFKTLMDRIIPNYIRHLILSRKEKRIHQK